MIEHGSRRVRVLGATEHPVQSWVIQQARNLLMDLGDATGTRAKFVLHDRDSSFTQASDAVFPAAGIRVIRSAAPSAKPRRCGLCRIASPTWNISGSGGMTAWVASSTNIAWWHRFSAPTSR